MSAEVLVFDILAVIAVIGALGVVLFRNPVHSAVSLVVTFINMAAIFVILRAEFLAAVQVIVYTGAILVLVLFVIMLVRTDDLPDFHTAGRPMQRVIGFVLGLVLLGEIAAAVLTRTVVGQQGPWTEENLAAAGGNVQVLGQIMYSGYVLPIQATAVILLVGTVAALVLARPDLMPCARPTTATISLGHPRGDEVGQLASGGVATRTAPAEQRGTARGGLIFVDDAESYTESTAWGADTSPRGSNGAKG